MGPWRGYRLSCSLYPHKKSLQSDQNSPSTNELRYWLALLYAPGVGSVFFQRILSANIKPEQLFNNPAVDVLGNDVKLPTKTLTYF